MEIKFKPKISSEITVVDDVTTEINIYNVVISNYSKSIQKSYIGVVGVNLTIDDFSEVGTWKIVISLNEKIVFETELIKK